MSNTPDRLTAAYNQVKKDVKMLTSASTWKNMTQNQIIGGLTVALLVVGVITGVYLGGQGQDVRQQAATAPYGACLPGSAPQCFDNIQFRCLDGDWVSTGQACTCNSNNQCSDNKTCIGNQCVLVCDVPSANDPQCAGRPWGSACGAHGMCGGGSSGTSGQGCTCIDYCDRSLDTACADRPTSTQCAGEGSYCQVTSPGGSNSDCVCVGPQATATPIPGGATNTPVPTSTPGTGNGTPVPTNTPGGPTPTQPPSTPIPTPPVGVSQATIRICKAIMMNGQMLTSWDSLPETRFRVQFDKKPPLRDLPGENGIPSGYGTKPLDTISFKTTDPGNLQQRPNINNVYASCQDLVVEYNDGDRQDVTFMKETIEQKDANGNWVAAAGWNAPVYNDSILIKDIDGNPNTTDTVAPSVTGIYDGSLFDGSSDQDAIGRTRYSDGYIRVNNSHNNVTLLMINDLSQVVSTPTNTPGNGPICVNVSVNDLTNPDPSIPPAVGDNVTLTCAQVAGAQRYEFAMRSPDNTWTLISQSSNVVNVSEVFQIASPGNYMAQCRPCTGRSEATCTPWEVPMN